MDVGKRLARWPHNVKDYVDIARDLPVQVLEAPGRIDEDIPVLLRDCRKGVFQCRVGKAVTPLDPFRADRYEIEMVAL